VKPDEFSDVLIAKLAILQPHTFVAVRQATYMKELKSVLHLGIVFVVCDFFLKLFLQVTRLGTGIPFE
jgi:hypothetical protein